MSPSSQIIRSFIDSFKITGKIAMFYTFYMINSAKLNTFIATEHPFSASWLMSINTITNTPWSAWKDMVMVRSNRITTFLNLRRVTSIPYDKKKIIILLPVLQTQFIFNQTDTDPFSSFFKDKYEILYSLY